MIEQTRKVDVYWRAVAPHEEVDEPQDGKNGRIFVPRVHEKRH